MSDDSAAVGERRGVPSGAYDVTWSLAKVEDTDKVEAPHYTEIKPKIFETANGGSACNDSHL
jgi:hypothetical protein